jgi:hypothetical protein
VHSDGTFEDGKKKIKQCRVVSRALPHIRVLPILGGATSARRAGRSGNVIGVWCLRFLGIFDLSLRRTTTDGDGVLL